MPAPMVATTLAVYLVVYAVLLVAYIGVLFYIARNAGAGTGRGTDRRAVQGLPGSQLTHQGARRNPDAGAGRGPACRVFLARRH